MRLARALCVATARVQSRGTGEFSDLVSLRTPAGCEIGQSFRAAEDSGIVGSVFHNWEGGAWLKLNHKVSEDQEMASFELEHADQALHVKVPSEPWGRLLGFDGRLLLEEQQAATPSLETLNLKTRMLEPNERGRITQPLVTGVAVVDALTPIGRGQSMVLCGPKGSGKRAVALQAVASQHRLGAYCVVIMLGKSLEQVKQLMMELKQLGAGERTTVVCDLEDSGDSKSPTNAMMATLVGTALAEQARDAGRNALLIHGALDKHHTAYRQMFQLLEPDIDGGAATSTHRQLYSGLLQRSAVLQIDGKLGQDGTPTGSLSSMALLDSPPTTPDDFMSICDGQLWFTQAMADRNQRPAINPGKSLSRIGAPARVPALQQMESVQTLRMDLSQHADDKMFGGDGNRAMERVAEAFKQGKREVRSLDQQVVNLIGCLSAKLKHVPVESMLDSNHGLLPLAKKLHPSIISKLADGSELEAVELDQLNDVCNQYAGAWEERTLVRGTKIKIKGKNDGKKGKKSKKK